MPTLDPATITLQTATAADTEFLYRVYAHTRYEELAPTQWPPEQVESFLRMQFHAQDTHYRANFTTATFDLILLAGEPVGRLYVDRRSDAIHIIDIALLPSFRGRGIGTLLLTALLAEASRAKIPTRIHVEVHNPAIRWYERLGFVRTHTVGLYYFMECALHSNYLPAPK